MSLPAADCLQRGVRTLIANWPLLPLLWLGSIAIAVLVILGVAVPLLGLGLNLGLDLLRGLARADGPASFEEWLGSLAGTWPPTLAEVALGIAALLVFWGLAGCLYAFLRAGLFGTLEQAEAAAAAAGAGHAPFRVVSWSGFLGWGRRYFGRYFGLVNLYGLFLLAGFLPLALGLAALVAVDGPPSGVALAGGGCLGGLFAFLALVGATVWYWVAEAELAEPGASVSRASRRALAVLGRRPGAVALLVLLAVAASFALSLVTFPFSTAGSLFLRDDFWAQLSFQIVLSVIQGALGVVPQIALAGAFVALVRGERDAGRPAPFPPSVEVMVP